MNRHERRDAERKMRLVNPAARIGIKGVDQALIAYRERRFGEAERIMDRVLAADPSDPSANHFLGVIAHRLGKLPLAFERLHQALALAPEFAEAHHDLGLLLLEHKRLDEAVERFEAALRLRPDYAKAEANYAEALSGLGRYDDAIAAAQRAIRQEPFNRAARARLSAALLATGRAAEALAAADVLLGMEPASQLGWARRALALQALGRVEEARDLLGLDRLVATPELSMKDGLAALAAEIRAHRSLGWSPISPLGFGGRMTSDLMIQPKPATRALIEALGRTIGAYRASLSRDPRHPFLARVPERFGMTLTGLVLAGGGAYKPPIDDAAWLSGYVVVEAPAHIRADDTAEAGWIELGGSDVALPESIIVERRALPPIPGRAVLFSAYVFSAIRAFDGEGETVLAAFNVYPLG